MAKVCPLQCLKLWRLGYQYTRPVGGLVDFFENGKMGYMIESLEPKIMQKN